MKKTLRYLCVTAALTIMISGMANARPASETHVPQDQVSREVRHELVMLPQFSIFDNLAYKVDGDTVTLFGQVRNAILKDSAESAVKSIAGVDRVNNQIEILPVSFNDDRIRRKVARAVFDSSQLFRYSIQPVPPIHIIVKNGHVTLDGVVANQGDKNIAGLRANGVSDVFSVENNLTVENQSEARK